MRPLKTIVAGTLALLAAVPLSAQTRAAENKKPNILFIITDDHAYQTLGTGKDDSPVALPNFNKLGRQGMVFDRSYCANSLCGPSRACILTGRHSHMNGFVFNGQKPLDGSQPTYPKMLQKAGYQTGLFGKWHLESNPTGFDTWEIFPGQGSYYNPDFISLKPDGKRQTKRFPAMPRTWSRTNPSSGWKTGTRTSPSCSLWATRLPTAPGALLCATWARWTPPA